MVCRFGGEGKSRRLTRSPPSRRAIMADDCYFLPEDAPIERDPGAAQDAGLATPEQWAAMKFAPVIIDANKFGPGWDQTRGAIARTAIALLRFDDEALT